MDVETRVLKLEGTMSALTDILSGHQVDSIDGEEIKRFIENYGLIGSIVGNETVDVFLSNIVLAKGRFDQVSLRLDGLLSAAEAESDKLVSQLGGGASGLALNMADSALFRASVGDAYKSMMQHLSNLDITGKINQMDSSLSEALALIEDMRSQRSQINVLLQKIADNKALIDNMDEVNNNQTTLINTSQNLIAELSKQIENYAFYAEEFDKVYVTAVNFVGQFSSLVEELARVSARDDAISNMLRDVISVSTHDFTTMETHVATMSDAMDRLGTDTAQKINDMLLFVTEYNAVGTAVHAVIDRFQAVKTDADAKAAEMDLVTFGLVV